MNALLNRHPLVTLAALILGHLLLVTAQIRNEEGTTLLRSWGLWLFTPVASALHLVTDGMQGAAQNYLFLYNARQENERLRAENARLRIELAQLRGLYDLVNRTEAYRAVQKQYRFNTVMAAIVWKSAPFYSHRLLINVGSWNGVKRNMAVITDEGVVGRVAAVSPFSAEAELLTNQGAAAGAMVGESRLQGVLQGQGSRILTLSFVPNYERVEVGEVVYTSGTDPIYPKGLPIGRVIKSERSTLVYREIEVLPFVDYGRLEEVMVVRQAAD